MPLIKDKNNVRVPKEYARHKRLVAVPESQYRAFVKFQEEQELVLGLVERARLEQKNGKTRRITSSNQLLGA